MYRIIYRIVLLFTVSACLLACNQNDKKISGWEINDVYHSTIITPTATGGKTFQGPPINTMDADNTYEMFSLKADQSTQGTKSYELLAQLTYFSQWRFYESATLEGTPSTNFKVVAREAGACGDRGCIFRELLSIQLNEAFIKDHIKKGFIITISSKAGVKSDLFVPPQYIQGYMQAIAGSPR